MKEQAYKNWLIETRGLAESSANSRVSSCAAIEAYEGDLDGIFDEDTYENLLQRLTYSTKDKQAGLQAKHSIPIKGDVYNGTATYKSAAKLYFKFRESQNSDIDNSDKGTSQTSKYDFYVGELLGRERFLEDFDADIKVLSADPLFGILIDYVDLIAAKKHTRPSVETTKECIKSVFNEVEADKRFDKMGVIAEKVTSWGQRKNSAYISVYYAIKMLLDEETRDLTSE